MEIKPKFKFGDIVYLKTDEEGTPRMVIGYHIRKAGILYELQVGCTEISAHYDFEIVRERYQIDLYN